MMTKLTGADKMNALRCPKELSKARHIHAIRQCWRIVNIAVDIISQFME